MTNRERLGIKATKETATDYLRRIAKMVYADLNLDTSRILSNTEASLVGAGLLTWEEAYRIEEEVLA